MNKLILVVDDDPDITFIIKRVMSKKGYSVKEAHGGEECLALLKNESPDLIFMDVMMSTIDGWETSRKIKTDSKTKDIPIAMLTVKCQPEDEAKSLDYALADAHLNKPIDFEMILSTAEALI
jgi:two-component system response regulator VicR